MPYSIVLYTRYGAYEPGSRYYLTASPVPNQSSIAENLADAQALIIPSTVTIVRWELLNTLDVKIDEGALNTAGTLSGEFSEFKFAAFIRLNSAGEKRPSTKYVHPLPESSLVNGVPTSAWLISVANYALGLLAANVADSEGNAITGVSFRRGTRRKNVRLAE